MPASRQGWKDIANVYNYLWGFLTWSYKSFTLLLYYGSRGIIANTRGILRSLSDFDAVSLFHLSNDPDSLIYITPACQEGIQVLSRDTQ